MNTPGYEQWFALTCETIDGRTGKLTCGKDDAGGREGFQWWCFTPNGAAKSEDMMIAKMWSGEPRHEKRPNAASPWNTLKSIGSNLFTYRKVSA